MENYYLFTLKDCALLLVFLTVLIGFNVLTIKTVLSMSRQIGFLMDDIQTLILDNVELTNENNKINKINTNMSRIKNNPIPSHVKDAYITSQINLNTECVLCLENIESINSAHLTSCGHLFHTDCFNKIRMVRNKRQCPTCRT